MHTSPDLIGEYILFLPNENISKSNDTLTLLWNETFTVHFRQVKKKSAVGTYSIYETIFFKLIFRLGINRCELV